MKIRMHRELLDSSMQAAEVIDPTKEAICAYLSRQLGQNVDKSVTSVEEYSKSPDKRIGWNETYLVLWWGKPVAFVDEPVIEPQQSDDGKAT